MKRYLFALAVFVFVSLSAIACSPMPTPTPPMSAPVAATRPAAPTSAPMATSAPGAAPSSSSPQTGANATQAVIVPAQRKIIKNAQFMLTVESSDTTVDRLTGIAGDFGGYLTSSRTFFEGGLKAATVSFAVPVDRFEEALRRVRGLAIKVDQESVSGQDVTDQYVDLESQLRNLEATADRIREFLKKAQTVEEALKVNQQLSQVEKDIETIKGKLNYLGDRAAFSTITVEAREPRPTPTITPTPTPTATPTPATWRPDKTLENAVDAQATLLRALVDLLIWLTVVFLPYLVVLGLGVWLFMRVMRWLAKRATKTPPAAPPSSEAN